MEKQLKTKILEALQALEYRADDLEEIAGTVDETSLKAEGIREAIEKIFEALGEEEA